MAKFRDYYQTLGVEQAASADEIKKAYRRLARKYHPDVSRESGAEARMKELNEANAVLSHAGRRALFDFRRHGEDHHVMVFVDLADAYRGATRAISLRTPQVDPRGRVVLRRHTLHVRIPVGVKEGQEIRLAGRGKPGPGGSAAGDLYLEIRFRPDPRYRVEGRNVYERVRVTPSEAARGARINTSAPFGIVKVQVPAGSRTGRKLRLKGRGIPGSPPGDLYIVLEVRVPPADTAEARVLKARFKAAGV